MEFFKQTQELVVVNVLLYSNFTKYVCVQLKKAGHRIKIVEDVVIYENIEKVKKFTNSKEVLLLFNGEKILYTVNVDLFKSTIHQFYTTKYLSNEDREFLALARKEEIDKIIVSFLNLDISIIDVYFGGFSVSLFYKQNFNDSEFKTSYFSLLFGEKDCLEVQKITSSFVEEEIEESKEGTIALSLVYDYFYPSEKLFSNYENQVITANKIESGHKFQFQFYGKIALSIVFLLMLLSFGITKFFENQNQKLESKLNYLIKEEALLNKLHKEKNKKEEILRTSGFLNTYGITYWVNTIIQDIPESILLSELEVFPMKQVLKENKKIVLEGNQIMVKGISFNENKFKIWAKKLTDRNEIFKIEIVNYSQKKSQEVKFELKIQLQG
ncbi:hypothetical protein [Tenacibaculum sp. nBUS_03]|uniref:hypothetical protein n=1 Tax=Tenacibaculum sp. nBUS_03 TaxID=3395320 RepID=UPI003EBE4A68